MHALEKYNKVAILLAETKGALPRMLAKDILDVQPMTAPAGAIFNLRYQYDPFHKVRPNADNWFTGYSDNRTLMHPFKYGDKYLDGDTYFFKLS